MKIPLLASLLGLAVLPRVALAEDTAQLPQKLDVETAVQRALSLTPGLESVRARQRAAEDQADSLRGRMLPTINLHDEQDHYNAPFNVAFGIAGFTVYNINTNVFAASAEQPLLGLLHLTEDHAALNDAANAASEQTASVASTVREQVQTGFLRYFEATAMIDVAKTSETQLAEQHTLSTARLNAGVITRADVLRIETAQANAKLQEVQAQAQADAAKSAILVTLGYPPGSSGVELVQPQALIDAAMPAMDEPTAENQAQSQRHEVAAAKLQISAANHQEQSALYKLLPEIDLQAQYTHIHGEVLAPEDAAFLGLKANWPIFTWGADYYGYRAQAEQSQAAALAAEDEARTVRIDATGKLAQLKATASAVELANTAITSAEEAYRVTNAQVTAGVATSTSDLLDAQSALTQAKLQLARAKFERAIAVVALQRAVGG